VSAKATSEERGAGTHVWLVLMKAHRTLARHAQRSIERLDMCLSDFAVLEVLLHRGAQPVNEIGRRVELTSGAITTAVDRLAERGLVVRTASKTDRRTRVVSLTPTGRAQIREIFRHHERAMDLAAAGLDRAERATLVHLLKTLGKHAELQLAEPPAGR
jgi:MarR family transcriptional regulator, 2-MHQ and catechol-resistance regulon repressor